MAKQIKQLDEETTTVSADLVVVQKSSNDDYVKVELSNLLPDGSIDATKIDSNATGHGYVKLGSTTLSGAADTISVSFSYKKYIRVLVRIVNSGSVNAFLQLNGDTANNYAYRSSHNGAADGTATSQPNIEITNSAAQDIFAVIDIYNASGNEALVVSHCVKTSGGAGNAPARSEGHGKYVASANLTSLSINNTSTGDFASGSEVIVLGLT